MEPLASVLLGIRLRAVVGHATLGFGGAMWTTLLLLSPSALAWEHLGHRWLADELPAEVLVSCPDAEVIDEDLLLDATQIAWEGWAEAADLSCGELPELELRVAEPDEALEGFVIACVDDLDGAWADGSVDTEEVLDSEEAVEGVTAALVGWTLRLDGDAPWALDPEECDGSEDVVLLEALIAHELGHALGLGHSAEQGEIVSDPALTEALMHWATPACEDAPVVPQGDDQAGIAALYGASAEIVDVQMEALDGGATQVCAGAWVSPWAEGQLWTLPDASTSTDDGVCFELPAETSGVLSLVATMPDCESQVGDRLDILGRQAPEESVELDSGGCGCASGPEAGSVGWMVLALPWMWGRRRR